MASSGENGVVGQVFIWSVLVACAAIVLASRDDWLAVATQDQSARLAVNVDPRDAARRNGIVTEIAVARDGHFHAEAEINGRPIDVLVDTGASMVALTYEDAERVGVRPRASDFTMSVQTANGRGKVAPVRIARVTIGNVTVRNVEAAVVERGRLQKSLLGMSFLGRLSRVDMRMGVLALEE